MEEVNGDISLSDEVREVACQGNNSFPGVNQLL